MKRLFVLLTLAAMASPGLPGEERVVLAQIACTGHATQAGVAIMGTPGADYIDCSASTLDLVILGLGGDDFIIGGPGNDLINAGEGDDWVFAGPGNNTLIGGGGDDALFAESGRDLLRGGPGNDVLFGGAGDDLLYGGEGNDPLFGAEGTDLCDGQEGTEDWASISCELTLNVP